MEGVCLGGIGDRECNIDHSVLNRLSSDIHVGTAELRIHLSEGDLNPVAECGLNDDVAAGEIQHGGLKLGGALGADDVPELGGGGLGIVVDSTVVGQENVVGQGEVGVVLHEGGSSGRGWCQHPR